MSAVKLNVISFDFDGTLNDHFNGDKVPYVHITRDWIKRLKKRGYDIYIVTRRFGPENSSQGKGNEHEIVWKIAEELGISKNRIVFTNREWKFSTLQNIGSSIHIDDDETEKYWIERHAPEIKVIWLEKNDWEATLVSCVNSHDSFKIWLSNEGNLTKLGITIGLSLLGLLLFV